MAIIFEPTFMGDRTKLKYFVSNFETSSSGLFRPRLRRPQKTREKKALSFPIGGRMVQIMRHITGSLSHAPASFLILKRQRAKGIQRKSVNHKGAREDADLAEARRAFTFTNSGPTCASPDYS
jgi:hypothetical protein